MNKTDKQKVMQSFLLLFNINYQDLATILGLSNRCVKYWIDGNRVIPDHIIKLINLFSRKPELLNEFY